MALGVLARLTDTDEERNSALETAARGITSSLQPQNLRLRRAVRNLDKVKLIAADQLNVFDLLNAQALVVGEDALATIQEVYGDD